MKRRITLLIALVASALVAATAAAVAFADGHVTLVTPEQAKALRWKP